MKLAGKDAMSLLLTLCSAVHGGSKCTDIDRASMPGTDPTRATQPIRQLHQAPLRCRASESGAGDARNPVRHNAELCTENAAAVQTSPNSSIQACNASAQKHDGQARQDTRQDGQGFKEPWQKELPAAPSRAAVEAGVQTTLFPYRVPVQAVLLPPASSLHQVMPTAIIEAELTFCRLQAQERSIQARFLISYRDKCAGLEILQKDLLEAYVSMQNVDNSAEKDFSTPTAQELEALQKLRAGLNSAADQPLRAFTHVKDLYIEDSGDWATNSPGMIH